MANLKAFKEVLDIAIKDDVVKVLIILDQELKIHTKQNVINKINDLKANKIDNAQIELFNEMPTGEDHVRFCAHI